MLLAKTFRKRFQPFLLRHGLIVTKTIDAASLKELISWLRPKETGIELIRVGGDGDGGYLVPDDLKGISTCFSPGVSESAFFEEDLAEKFSIESHLADYSVDGPPDGFLPKTFTKKFVGAASKDEFVSMDDWLESSVLIEENSDWILQMDIEGSEYESLLSISNANLQKFRIIVLEIHGIQEWAFPAHFKIVRSFFEKLLQEFSVVHIHPNNCCGLINISGVECPKTFEMTLFRRDRFVESHKFAQLPHPLDRRNVTSHSEINLPWFANT
jgi:hypothetical protein